MRLFPSVVALIAMLGGMAHAAPVLSPELRNDADLAAYLAGQGVTLPDDAVAVGQGIIGNNKAAGRRELGLFGQPDLTSPILGGAGYRWGSRGGGNTPTAFTLQRTGDVLSFEIAGYAGSVSGALIPLIDGLVFRTYGRDNRRTSSSATLSDLTLNGVDYGSVTDGSGKSAIRVLEDIGVGDFTLTGLAALDWTGKRPRNANLGFQIIAFDAPAVVPVPEPATALLLLGGLAGLTVVRRRVGVPG